MSDIHEYVSKIKIMDAHEHISSQSYRMERQEGVFDLLHYLESDLITAGMPRGAMSSDIGDEQKANLLSYYLSKTKNTAYAKSFILAMRDLYHAEDWSSVGILALNDKIKKASNDPLWYRKVIQEYAGVEQVLTLGDLDGTEPYIHQMKFFDFYFMLESREQIKQLEKNLDTAVHTLEDYVRTLPILMEQCVMQGLVATKLGYAYKRTLRVDKVTYSEAEKVFNKLLQTPLKNINCMELKMLQDFLIHEVIKVSTEKGLPIQIHTGHHEPSVTDNGNKITNSRVTDLIPLLLEYEQAKFVLLHAGLPYYHEYLSIVKNYPNVYADMTWAYIISPSMSHEILKQMLEMVPWTKIQGFGGDYLFVEGIYGHSMFARKVISSVLENKIKDGYLNQTDAEDIADGLLRENILNLYGIHTKNDK